MQINNSIGQKPPNFKGRCTAIKDAQDVCLAVRRNFPYTAYSKAAYEASNKILKKENILDFILKKNKILLTLREDRKFIKNPIKFYKEVIYASLNEKLANCYELATLAEMIMRMNGVKNCGKLGLVSKSGVRLNHCIAYVQTGEKFDPKKVIVIDPWLQDVDFLDKMLTKYKSNYKKYLNKMHPKDKIHLEFKTKLPLSEKDVNYLKDKYPSLIFKKQLFARKNEKI